MTSPLRVDRDTWRRVAEKLQDEKETLEADNAALRQDAEYYQWRLRTIIPLFEEARDALPAITMVAAKLHNVDLTLGDRMDRAGTATRAQFDSLCSGRWPSDDAKLLDDAALAGKEKE